MDIVIRPVKDRFLEEIAFPTFEMGMVNARVALERLSRVVADERTRLLVEVLLDRGVDGAIWSLDAEAWLETVYRLLFREWRPGEEGWVTPFDYPGYAGNWDETLHLALMLEHPRYPYWDEAESRSVREACVQAPDADLGLATLACGRWDPVPRFAAHEVLSTQKDRGVYRPGDLAIADWSWRPAAAVSFWAQQLPNKLGRLLKREQTRLEPLELPESSEILDYWMGRQGQPPALAVAFSGLGRRSAGWVREIGELARELRGAAERDQGLTILVPKAVKRSDGYDFGL